MRSIIAVTFVLILTTPALAASKTKKKDPPPEPAKEAPVAAPAPEPEQKPAPKITRATETDAPSPYGSGYESWSTRGGAMMKRGSALRATAFGGLHSYGDGYGNGGIEAMYFFETNGIADFGLGVRIAGWPLGAAPGLELRLKLGTAGAAHFAFMVTGYVPFCFRGMFAGMSIGAHSEAGFLMSYFVKDNVELIFGITGSATLLMVAYSLPVIQGGPNAKLGLTYTLKRHDIGLFVLADISPGWYAPYGRPRATSSLASQRAEAYLIATANFMVGVQVKL